MLLRNYDHLKAGVSFSTLFLYENLYFAMPFSDQVMTRKGNLRKYPIPLSTSSKKSRVRRSQEMSQRSYTSNSEPAPRSRNKSRREPEVCQSHRSPSATVSSIPTTTSTSKEQTGLRQPTSRLVPEHWSPVRNQSRRTQVTTSR